ncbi:MAG: PD-(D/E)XK nuclease family protein [Aulosira sp. ZfuVER01]|nr:PD-(D/E)XK nuclease family protein [Aulosira sp. ZfuVER01]MDZ7998976.1 PD-(D/E)XK nuclease family protein [Aulosira sp. DedVER01a]MDZ8056378.1 PD-(D/E)XK nuclease family protein [Aulosira sp. ZfuCHP01]
MAIPPTEQALLEKFIVDNEELDNLESKLAQFNIFEAIGVVRQEIRHSNFLAFLLNPSQNHRLDDIFLKQFLKQVLLETEQPTNVNYANIRSVDIDIADLTDAEVKREWQNIDIFIHSSSNKLVCAIENKVDSGEHSDQLERYRKIIENQYSNYRKILIYLTPKGNQPSDENWRIYKYSNVVELIDNICTSYKSTLGGDVSTLLTHYSTLIKRHIIMSDSELAELCRKIYSKHKQALDLIFEYRLDLQSEIASIVYDTVTKDIENKKGSVLLFSTKSVGFDIKEWKDVNLPIYFYFDNDTENLRLQLGISSGEQTIRKKIHQFSLNNPTIFKNNARWSDKWITIYQKDILNCRDYKLTNIEDLIKKIQDFWENFIKDDFLKIEKIINENKDKLIN